MSTLDHSPPPPDNILAIDGSPFAIRAAVVQSGLKLLDSLEAKPSQFERVVRFVAKHFRENCGPLRIIGSPLDNWPQNFQHCLENDCATPRWLPPNLARDALRCWAPWQMKRRLLRARFLAFLAHQDRLDPHGHYAPALVLRWERLIAEELLQEIDTAARHARLKID